MKRQIRWLKTFRQPVSPRCTWKPLGEPPEAIRSGGFITFEKGSEITVHVRGSDRLILSVPGIGDLGGITEGEHFEFVDAAED